MRLTTGFKSSQVGLIPEDWAEKTLMEVCSFENGDRSNNYPSPKDYCASGISFINAGHVADGYIDTSQMNYITQAAYDRLGGGKIKAGDVLFCLRGSLGKFGVVGENFGEGAIASSLVIIRPKANLITLGYLRCYLGSPISAHMIDKWAGGAAQPNLGAKELAKFVVPLPEIAEQNAISQSLNDVEDLLVKLDEVIAKKHNLKQAVMHELLTGKTRLSGFSGDWSVKLLGDISQIKTGKRNNEDKVEDGLYPFFVRSATVEKINSYSYECEAILVPGEGQIGNIFHYVNERFDVHQRVYAITNFADGVVARYIYFFMSQHFGPWAMQNSVKATVDSLRLPTFESFEIRLPPSVEEQSAIVNIVSAMEEELFNLEKRRDKARDVKLAMMQELLSGKKRLLNGKHGNA